MANSANDKAGKLNVRIEFFESDERTQQLASYVFKSGREKAQVIRSAFRLGLNILEDMHDMVQRVQEVGR